jgi:hypothetical protein
MSLGGRKPITRPRSSWREVTEEIQPATGLDLPSMVDPHMWVRPVSDGVLRALRTVDNGLLHLSVSWQPHGPRQALRYPTWDELADARDALLPAELEFHMILPRASEYVAVHDTTFHLHEFPTEVAA